MAVFQYSWADFLDKDEMKKYKNELPELPEPAVFTPFDKAVKLNLTKEEMEAIYNAEKAKLEEMHEQENE